MIHANPNPPLPALLPYCPTALLPYCPTALLPYCPTALLSHQEVDVLPDHHAREMPI
jgi:hypothetical protein